MTLIDVYLWSDTGSAVYKCESAFGTGACLHSSVAATSYAATSTAYNKPISMTAVPTLAGDLTAGFGSTASIATPSVALPLADMFQLTVARLQNDSIDILPWSSPDHASNEEPVVQSSCFEIVCIHHSGVPCILV